MNEKINAYICSRKLRNVLLMSFYDRKIKIYLVKEICDFIKVLIDFIYFFKNR